MRFVPKDAGVGSDLCGGASVADAGVGSGSGWVFPIVASSVDSEIGSNLLAVVNWRMGTVAPLSGVIPTGGDGPGLRWGVSIHSSSMWFCRVVSSDVLYQLSAALWHRFAAAAAASACCCLLLVRLIV